MDTIRRKISLEQFKTRIPEKDENGSKWGEIHNDYVVGENDNIYPLRDTLPMLQSGETNNYILRYKTMLRWYLFLRNFAATSSLYTVLDCGNGSKKWRFNDVEDSVKFSYLESANTIVEIELPAVSSVTDNTVALINDDAFLFSQTFRADGRNHEGEFISWYNERFVHATSIPFVDINLLITQDIDDEGILTAPVDRWIPKKKYYLGDKTYYEKGDEGSVYTLIKGDEFEVTELTKALYYSGYSGSRAVVTGETPSDYTKETVYYDDSTGVYRLYTPYYCGYYDKQNKVVLFDESEGEHWAISSAFTLTKESTPITGVMENYLASVTPSFFSYDDNGEILPFRTVTKETMPEGSEDGTIEYMPYTTLNFTFDPILDPLKESFFNCLSSITLFNNTVSLSGKTYDEYRADEASGLTSLYTVNEKCEVLMDRYGNASTVESMYDIEIEASGTTELFKLTSGDVVTEEDKEAFETWLKMCRIVRITSNSELTNILNSAETPSEQYEFVTKYCNCVNIAYFIDNKSGDTIDNGVYHEDILGCAYMEYPCRSLKYSGVTKMAWIKCDVPTGGNTTDVSVLPPIPKMNIIYRYTGGEVIEGSLNGEKYYIRSGDTICYRNVFDYIYLSKETPNESDGINIDYKGEKLIFSNISYTKKVDDDYQNFQLIGNFKDERTLGLQDINERGIDVYVDRGRYAAFENHNILSEVNTFNDLLNYRNDFFGLTPSDDDG